MTDELTPEEREALESLPRERMPSAALEDRVVVAMRAKGFVAARPSRVVRITNSRVAGLLAACIVLIVGAYAIGLHRGDDNAVIRGVQNPQLDELSKTTMSEPAPSEDKELDEGRVERQLASPPAAPAEVEDKKAPSRLDWKLKANQASKDDAMALNPEAAGKLGYEAPAEGAAKEEAKAEDAAAAQPPSVMSQGLTSRATKSGMGLRAQESAQASRERAYSLNGTRLLIDAPDSVRVVRDDQGRWLLIYTSSDGVIRIRLVD